MIPVFDTGKTSGYKGVVDRHKSYINHELFIKSYLICIYITNFPFCVVHSTEYGH